MAMHTALGRWVDNCLIEACGIEPVTKPEWGRLVAAIAFRRAERRGGLVVTGGAGPSRPTNHQTIAAAPAEVGATA
jgi:hypothetical protein